MTGVYTSQQEVQTAIYNLLVPSGLDSTLSGLGLLAVYDRFAVPQNAPFDYLTIGEGYELPNNTLDAEGSDKGFYLFTTLHLWSTQRGTQNPSAMVARINQILTNKNNQPWTLATLHHVYTMLNRTTWLQDTTGIIPVLHVAIQHKHYCQQT